MTKVFPLLIIMMSSLTALGQEAEAVKPGVLYPSGSTIESPKYGFKGTLPENWTGMLPQGTEIFMLNKKDGTSGQILLFANPDSDFDEMKKAWNKGISYSPSIYLKAAGEIQEEDGLLFSEVLAEGDRINRSYRGLVIGKCSPYDPCVTMLILVREQFFDEIKGEMMEFMRKGEFVEPGKKDLYENFDWKTFLSNKMLVTYSKDQEGSRENEIHLCEDGTFSSSVNQTGWLKHQNKSYLGKNKGTWMVSGTGNETTLKLTFNKGKIPALDITLRIEDDKIYAEGERYYAGYSAKCIK
jgi:hypothetical protein